MLPIHLAIGIVEGGVTAAIVAFVRDARPSLLEATAARTQSVAGPAVAFLCAALVLGGVGAWFASKSPDGLEWSVVRSAAAAAVAPTPTQLHATIGSVQQETALLPHYGFRGPAATGASRPGHERLGTSVAGILGGFMTLALALLVGVALKARPGRH